MGRLWRKDPGVWTGADEARWLGWLDLAGAEVPADALTRFADGARADGFTDVLLLGMGGSSLGAEVIGRVLGPSEGAPRLRVLDTTDPVQIERVASRLDLSRTLCIVSSKSGTTLEPALLAECFLDRMRQAVGSGRAGAHFVAITDPGSALEEMAGAEGFGPDLAPERGALGLHRHLELPQLAREVGFELRDFAGESGVVANPVRSGLQRFRCPLAGRVRPRWIAVRDGDVTDCDLVPGDEQPSDGGFVPGVSHDGAPVSMQTAFEYAVAWPRWETV